MRTPIILLTFSPSAEKLLCSSLLISSDQNILQYSPFGRKVKFLGLFFIWLSHICSTLFEIILVVQVFFYLFFWFDGVFFLIAITDVPWQLEVFRVEEKRSKPSSKPGCLQERPAVSLTPNAREQLTCLLTLQSHLHPACLHMWSRPDSDLAISEFMCCLPAYMFMLQSQQVLLERKKKQHGIGSLAP